MHMEHCHFPFASAVFFFEVKEEQNQTELLTWYKALIFCTCYCFFFFWGPEISRMIQVIEGSAEKTTKATRKRTVPTRQIWEAAIGHPSISPSVLTINGRDFKKKSFYFLLATDLIT